MEFINVVFDVFNAAKDGKLRELKVRTVVFVLDPAIEI